MLMDLIFNSSTNCVWFKPIPRRAQIFDKLKHQEYFNCRIV